MDYSFDIKSKKFCWFLDLKDFLLFFTLKSCMVLWVHDPFLSPECAIRALKGRHARLTTRALLARMWMGPRFCFFPVVPEWSTAIIAYTFPDLSVKDSQITGRLVILSRLLSSSAPHLEYMKQKENLGNSAPCRSADPKVPSEVIT